MVRSSLKIEITFCILLPFSVNSHLIYLTHTRPNHEKNIVQELLVNDHLKKSYINLPTLFKYWVNNGYNL